MDNTLQINGRDTEPAGASGTDDQHADSFRVVTGDQAMPLIILCDHASNRLPAAYGSLGVSERHLERHIAFDIGTEALGDLLAERLGAAAIFSQFSRLLIDPNRGEDDPTLIMQLSDGAIVPGNADVDGGERERRLARYYRPYHQAISDLIDSHLAAGRAPILFSLHSFTPDWKGTVRPWHAGILWDKDPRFARPLIDRLGAEGGLFVGDNEPYTGWLQNDTMYRHGTVRGIAHALLEIRNDLICDPRGILEWADRLVPILRDIAGEKALATVRAYGSKSDPFDEAVAVSS
ncbi:MAG: N-formylglutamate amidohydrolase [Alphaproteobacteria bacterium]